MNKSDFDNLIYAETKRIERIMTAIKAPEHMFAFINRRARVSVMGKLVADGADLSGVS